jgi:hypothetical protein
VHDRAPAAALALADARAAAPDDARSAPAGVSA